MRDPGEGIGLTALPRLNRQTSRTSTAPNISCGRSCSAARKPTTGSALMRPNHADGEHVSQSAHVSHAGERHWRRTGRRTVHRKHRIGRTPNAAPPAHGWGMRCGSSTGRQHFGTNVERPEWYVDPSINRTDARPACHLQRGSRPVDSSAGRTEIVPSAMHGTGTVSGWCARSPLWRAGALTIRWCADSQTHFRVTGRSAQHNGEEGITTSPQRRRARQGCLCVRTAGFSASEGQ